MQQDNRLQCNSVIGFMTSVRNCVYICYECAEVATSIKLCTSCNREPFCSSIPRTINFNVSDHIYVLYGFLLHISILNVNIRGKYLMPSKSVETTEDFAVNIIGITLLLLAIYIYIYIYIYYSKVHIKSLK